ncbi:MAG TPA: hypothetical protein ACFYEF_04845 [Candidatus Wunengus sp. YC63]|uniref:hypothetical protein n=1 Tax=unclassified Candidatus Wunengus TaxID=3367695 RepID=UPI004029F616
MTDDKETGSSPMPCDFTKLQIAQSLRDYHHKALWEEEKHFTWLVSIIFSADILLATNDKIGTIEKSLLIFLVSLIGVAVSGLAWRVLRNESNNFQVALSRFIIQHNRCFRHPQLPEVGAYSTNKTLFKLLILGLLGRVSTRDSFQLIFVFFILLFILATGIAGYVAVLGIKAICMP